MSYREEVMSGEFTKYHLNDGTAPWPFYPVMHRFTAADKGGPHDHPWGFTSHVLSGGYVERVYWPLGNGEWDIAEFTRLPGTAHTVEANHIHELVQLLAEECWTLVLAGPKVREPRFWRFDERGVASRQWNEQDFTPEP